jgi:hypothetical protein
VNFENTFASQRLVSQEHSKLCVRFICIYVCMYVCQDVFAVKHILTSTRLLIRMHKTKHKTTRTSLPEDEHLVVRNMSKTI